MPNLRAGLVLAGLGASWLVPSCSDRIELGTDFPITAAGSVATAGSAVSGGSGANARAGGAFGGAFGDAASGGSGGAAAHTCQKTACQGQIYQCGDCLDNDGDHLVDSDDPDCTGPCDNTESSYYGGIPGQNNAPCREDCYFDANTGSGDDQCYWTQTCDPLSVAPGYPPSGDARCSYDPGASVPGSGSTCEGLAASQSNACLSFCLPITPNGCDCFGCCELPADSGKFVWIGSAQQNTGTCDAAHVADPAACHPCTPVKSCFNSCDPCEVCVGRTVPSASCVTPGSGRCLGTAAACGQPGEPDCPADQYCVTGCCGAAPR